MPTSASRPDAAHSSASANCSSPSFTPVLRVRLARVRLRQRHRHVEVVRRPAASAARKIGIVKRGSVAPSTRVDPVLAASSASIAAWSEASTCAATNRSSSARRHGPLGPGRVVVGDDDMGRRRAGGRRCSAAAEPTPPAPRMRMRMRPGLQGRPNAVSGVEAQSESDRAGAATGHADPSCASARASARRVSSMPAHRSGSGRERHRLAAHRIARRVSAPRSPGRRAGRASPGRRTGSRRRRARCSPTAVRDAAARSAVPQEGEEPGAGVDGAAPARDVNRSLGELRERGEEVLAPAVSKVAGALLELVAQPVAASGRSRRSRPTGSGCRRCSR